MKKSLQKITLTLAIATLGTLTTQAAFPVIEDNSVKSEVVNKEFSASSSDLVLEPIVTSELKKESLSSSAFGGSKSKIIAALLAFFLGPLGIHSFYMGQNMKGFLQLGGTLLGTVLYAVGLISFATAASTTGTVTLPILALIGLGIVAAVGIWAFIDFIRILMGNLEPEEGFDS